MQPTSPTIMETLAPPNRPQAWERRASTPALSDTTDRTGPAKPETGVGATGCSDCRSCAALRARINQLVHESTRDPLTNLYNRRGLFASPAVQRADVGLAIIYLDLDGVKLVNDQFGHSAGDDLIVSAANLVRHTLRSDDVVARIGGDEFAIAATGQDERSLEVIVDRLRHQFDGQLFSQMWSTPMLASIGAAIAAPGESATTVIARADTSMYSHKSRRRRRGTSRSNSIIRAGTVSR